MIPAPPPTNKYLLCQNTRHYGKHFGRYNRQLFITIYHIYHIGPNPWSPGPCLQGPKEPGQRYISTQLGAIQAHTAWSGRMWHQDAAVGEGREMVTGKVKYITFTLEKQILSLSQKGHWHFLKGQPELLAKCKQGGVLPCRGKGRDLTHSSV